MCNYWGERSTGPSVTRGGGRNETSNQVELVKTSEAVILEAETNRHHAHSDAELQLTPAAGSFYLHWVRRKKYLNQLINGKRLIQVVNLHCFGLNCQFSIG